MSLAGARPYLCRAIVVGGAASNQTERGGLFLAILSLMWTSIPKPLLSRAGRYVPNRRLGHDTAKAMAHHRPLSPLSYRCRVTLDKYTRISEELVNRLFLRPGIQVRATPDSFTCLLLYSNEPTPRGEETHVRCCAQQYAAWPDILSAVGTNDFGKHLTLYPGPVLFFHGQHGTIPPTHPPNIFCAVSAEARAFTFITIIHSRSLMTIIIIR
jgi:hypothetical protein